MYIQNTAYNTLYICNVLECHKLLKKHLQIAYVYVMVILINLFSLHALLWYSPAGIIYYYYTINTRHVDM